MPCFYMLLSLNHQLFCVFSGKFRSNLIGRPQHKWWLVMRITSKIAYVIIYVRFLNVAMCLLHVAICPDFRPPAVLLCKPPYVSMHWEARSICRLCLNSVYLSPTKRQIPYLPLSTCKLYCIHRTFAYCTIFLVTPGLVVYVWLVVATCFGLILIPLALPGSQKKAKEWVWRGCREQWLQRERLKTNCLFNQKSQHLLSESFKWLNPKCQSHFAFNESVCTSTHRGKGHTGWGSALGGSQMSLFQVDLDLWISNHHMDTN